MKLITNEKGNIYMTNDQKDLDFIKETIKKKPINKKRLFRRMSITITMAIIFGLVACFTFYYLQPIIINWIQPEKETTNVELPDIEDEVTLEEMVESDEEFIEKEDIEQLEEKTDETLEKLEQISGISTYQAAYIELKEVVKEIQKSLVSVENIVSGMDWFNTPYVQTQKSAGFIVADNGVEIIIITQSEFCNSADSIGVTFSTGESVVATIKQVSEPENLVALAIPLDSISDETKEIIQIARLSTSQPINIMSTPIIALGGPNNYEDFVIYGIVTSSNHNMKVTDRNYKYFTTDIVADKGTNGIVTNLQGSIIGIISNDSSMVERKSSISAIGITELKPFIELISNGTELPKLGIIAETIPDTYTEEIEMPEGAYVSKINMNSPAMKEGIQVGDIITKINDEEIKNATDYVKILRNHKTGDIINIQLYRQSVNGYMPMEIEIQL